MSEHIALAASQLGNLPITNTQLTSLLVVAVLTVVAVLSTRRMQQVPGGLQNLVEFAVESLLNLVDSIVGDHRKTKMFFPWVACFFLYIMMANYIGLLPGVGTIGYYAGETFVPFFRSPAADLNMTLGLALFSVILAHFYSVRELGWGGYLKVWLNINPALLFAGVLEFFLEFTKIASLSFRLFGNIFAGETIMEVVSTVISPYFVTLPFMALELVVGFVQALVFAMLTLASLMVLTTSHSAEHETA